MINFLLIICLDKQQNVMSHPKLQPAVQSTRRLQRCESIYTGLQSKGTVYLLTKTVSFWGQMRRKQISFSWTLITLIYVL